MRKGPPPISAYGISFSQPFHAENITPRRGRKLVSLAHVLRRCSSLRGCSSTLGLHRHQYLGSVWSWESWWAPLLSYQFVYLNISQVIMTALFILYVAVFTYLADW